MTSPQDTGGLREKVAQGLHQDQCADAGAHIPRSPETPPLSETERTVLVALYHRVGSEYCAHFKTLVDDTRLDRATVRTACRSLTAKGLARYERGLLTEDGELAGAGYGCTDDGCDLARLVRPCPNPDHELYPYYGVAPHECFYKKGAEFMPGQSTLLDRREWPKHFVLDLEPGEDPATVEYPNACGTYYCPRCVADGRVVAARDMGSRAPHGAAATTVGTPDTEHSVGEGA